MAHVHFFSSTYTHGLLSGCRVLQFWGPPRVPLRPLSDLSDASDSSDLSEGIAGTAIVLSASRRSPGD